MNKRKIQKVLNRFWQSGDNLEKEIIHIDDEKDLTNDLFALYVVGCSFSIGFAQYIAEEHYRLVNVENGKYYWKNETHLKTSDELLLDYKNTIH